MAVWAAGCKPRRCSRLGVQNAAVELTRLDAADLERDPRLHLRRVDTLHVAALRHARVRGSCRLRDEVHAARDFKLWPPGCSHSVPMHALGVSAPVNESPAFAGLPEGGRYWARTSDPQLVDSGAGVRVGSLEFAHAAWLSGIRPASERVSERKRTLRCHCCHAPTAGSVTSWRDATSERVLARRRRNDDSELRAAARRLAVTTTREQGLPLRVQDPHVLRRVASPSRRAARDRQSPSRA
jgi:hypothetical protein